MLNLREQDLQQGRALRPWQENVRAHVLRHDTPVRLRRQAAGDAQYVQRSFVELRISDWCRLYLDVPNDLDADTRLAEAVRQSGFERPDSIVCYPTRPFLFSKNLCPSQAALREKWGYIARFIDDTQALGVAAIKHMESRMELSHQILRELRSTLTPSARATGCNAGAVRDPQEF